MTLMRSTRLTAAAFALLASSATHAAAQAPVLTVTASGATVTINWTNLAAQGAVGYNLVVGSTSGGAQIANVNLPASITNIVVAAPAGTYFLRVRGLAVSGFGPYSNEASVTVGNSAPGPCVQPSTPTISTTVSGLSVTVDWGASTGAAGYRVEFSLTPTGTNLVQTVGAGTQSFNQYVGMAGTFYVRVVAVNGCGTATSSTVAFTTGSAGPTPPGSGPRTPDPAPGQLLPRPAYVAAVVEAMARAYPGDLYNSCREHGGNNVFMFRVLQALRQRDTRFGLNFKRGHYGDLSQDIISYNPTDRPDDRESRIYLWDIIGGHCGDRPGPNWTDVTEATWTQRGNPACGTEWCAMWTIEPYLRAGFPADPRQ